MSNDTKRTIIRRKDEEIAAELMRRLAGLQDKISERRRREDTRRKVLLGVGLLALNDVALITRVKAALSEKDRQSLRDIEGGEAVAEQPTKSPPSSAAGASGEEQPVSAAPIVKARPGDTATGSATAAAAVPLQQKQEPSARPRPIISSPGPPKSEQPN